VEPAERREIALALDAEGIQTVRLVGRRLGIELVVFLRHARSDEYSRSERGADFAAWAETARLCQRWRAARCAWQRRCA
jgi:hypothetical protein